MTSSLLLSAVSEAAVCLSPYFIPEYVALVNQHTGLRGDVREGEKDRLPRPHQA